MSASKGRIFLRVFLSPVFHWFLTVLQFSDSSLGFSNQTTSLSKVASSDRLVKMGSLFSNLQEVDHVDEKQPITLNRDFDLATDFSSLSVAMKKVLDETIKTENMYHDVLSIEFASALLKDSPKKEFDEQNDTFFLIRNETIIMKGVPRRPFYKEIIKRIMKMEEYYGEKGYVLKENEVLPRPLLPATDLDFTEIDSCSKIYPISPFLKNERNIIKGCKAWLTKCGEAGIRELLGLRSTIGTEMNLLPPPIDLLIHAANQPITTKANAKPPILTVAGRARTKHAHRGSKDQFFGISKGNNIEKNEAGEKIVRDIIQDAIWINIHVFGGVEVPIMEIRNSLGYGARWSAIWSNGCPSDIVFRGFLEPQMQDGFEKKWRH